HYTLPQVRLLGQGDFLVDLQNEEKLFRLMLFITFRIDETEINGAIIMDMTINSLHELINTLDKMEVGLYE
ncbi:MAG TPA: chemotaxis protein CheC, partial [Clostridia bacterium]|nr:chemotaxis protein CheC [Clostridia bacterium]